MGQQDQINSIFKKNLQAKTHATDSITSTKDKPHSNLYFILGKSAWIYIHMAVHTSRKKTNQNKTKTKQT